MTRILILQIDQVGLMAAIVKEISEQNGGSLPATNHLFNSCIEAANLLTDKLDNRDMFTGDHKNDINQSNVE